MLQFRSLEPKRPQATCSSQTRPCGSRTRTAGVEYRLKFTLEKRKGPGDPAELVGSQDMTYVLDAKNDQCSCELRFEDLSRGPEYRIQVKVFHANRPTAEPLDARVVTLAARVGQPNFA